MRKTYINIPNWLLRVLNRLWFLRIVFIRKVCLSLIRLGCDVNSKDNSSWTPLMLATKSGALKTAQALLNCQASIDLENNEGNTALLIAAIYGRVDISKLLLDSGACVKMRNKSDEGVIDLAVKHDTEDVVTEVIKHERYFKSLISADISFSRTF